MTFTESIFTRLSTYAGLAALTGTRVYPMRLPQNVTLPAVVYRIISKTPQQQLQGGSGLYVARVQVTAFGSSYDSAWDTADQVLLALHDFTGLLGGAGGVQCDVTIINQVDLMDPQPEATVYYIASDFEVWLQG